MIRERHEVLREWDHYCKDIGCLYREKSICTWSKFEVRWQRPRWRVGAPSEGEEKERRKLSEHLKRKLLIVTSHCGGGIVLGLKPMPSRDEEERWQISVSGV